jgi:lipopolysaccharide transport system permease protein
VIGDGNAAASLTVERSLLSSQADRRREPAGGRRRATVTIEPGKGWAATLTDLIRYRDTLYFLALRDLKVRYRQTFLGVAWAVLQPLALMGTFALFMGQILKIPSDNVPYPVFAYAGLVPWTLFAGTLVAASDSLIRDVNLVSKIYFPRLILPIASSGALLLDFVIALGGLFVLMSLYSIAPDGAHIAWLPLFALLALGLAVALGLWLSALNVMYRDVRAFVPFLVQVLLFASPVSYPSSVVPHAWRALYGLNPMAGVIEGFRWALLGTETPPGPMLAVSAVMVAALFAGGLVYFRRMDRVFADVI